MELLIVGSDRNLTPIVYGTHQQGFAVFAKIVRLLSPSQKPKETPLFFKDCHAAFEFACSYVQSELVAKGIFPALVEDAKLKLGADEPIVILQDGSQMLALRVSSNDGGFLVLSGVLSANGPRLKVGDLVAWQAGKPIERECYQLQIDPRSQWVGIVLAKLKPEYLPSQGWAIEESFRP